MKPFPHILLLAHFLLVFAYSSCAQSPVLQKNQVTHQYIDAYVNLDFEALGDYYDTSSVFQDPTLALIDARAALPVTGKAAILEKLNRNFAGITAPHYILKEQYTVGAYSIFSGIFEYTQNATAFGGPDLDIHFSLKSTTILTEQDGTILEHLEYMDYTAWFEQFETQKNAHK